MSQNPPPKDDRKRVPLGEPMDEDELMAMADMDEDAIADAVAWFDDKASPTGKRLMDAGRQR